MSLISALKNLLFPKDIKCIICDNELAFDSTDGICENCVLPLNAVFCKRCGRAATCSRGYCAECQKRLPPFELARAPFTYEGGAKKLVYKLKYGNGRFLASYMAKLMAEVVISEKLACDLIAFVPISARKLRVRGYNQAELLALELKKLLNIPCVNILDKIKDIKNTAKLKRIQRKEFIRDSIEVIPGVDFLGKSVLLVDDVFTTGTTAAECCEKLLNCGVSHINVVTFATSKILVKNL